jgi:ATP-binding cassette, sub-family E, member 1
MAEGMNLFLKDLQITFRRDEESRRPRINKPESVKDKEQRASGKLYYTG